VKNLATAEDKFKQLSITHDITKKERLQNREKLAEAKNTIDVLEKNNQEVKFKYLVKEPPVAKFFILIMSEPFAFSSSKLASLVLEFQNLHSFCLVWLHSLSSVYLYQIFYIVHLLLLYLLLFSLLVQTRQKG
jgi:hypothetical protein